MTDEDWIAALPLGDLPESRATKVQLDGTVVLLYRTDERIFAIGNRCTHQGAPLDRGAVKLSGSEATVTCPAHGSMFRLEDGRVLRGPATRPVPAYEVRVTEGQVEIRDRA